MLDQCNAYLKKFYQTQNLRSGIVLEAGAGSYSHFCLPEDSHVLCLDIDHHQLLTNDSGGLRVQADIHDIPLDNKSMSVVICFNVIEHLSKPEKAVQEMCNVITDEGIIIIGFPERNSLKGLITRFTPIGFHRWYYKNIVKKQDRGGGHYDAFETPFGDIVSCANIVQKLNNSNFDILFCEQYDGAKAYQITQGSALRRLASFPYYVVATLCEWLSLGRWKASLSDVLIVAKKSTVN